MRKGRAIEGPYIESPHLEAAGGSILFLEDGRLDVLELYANGDSFPESLTEYTLIRG